MVREMRNHKSLVAWQVANRIARGVLTICRTRWTPFAAALFTQLQRASLSVQLNLAEGYALGMPRRFVYHLRVAYGSAVETTELLELGMEEGVLTGSEMADLLADSRRSQRLLLGLLQRYGGSREAGGGR